jgi:hypothetical protein
MAGEARLRDGRPADAALASGDGEPASRRAPSWTPIGAGTMMRGNPDQGRRHGRRGLAAEPGPREV